MKVLVIGSGAREHALTWKISQSKKVSKIFCAPGNAGTEKLAENVDISAHSIHRLADFVKEKKIDLTIVGPEYPLVEGIFDVFKALSLPIFAPSKGAAQLEGSKIWAKKFMKKYKIPTALFKIIDNYEEGLKNLKEFPFPLVIKANGLAQGKGVEIVKNLKEAESILKKFMQKKILGKSGEKIILEEFLEGKEISILSFIDGKTILPMVSACDYKKIYNGDIGPNTGGMGAYPPASFLNASLNKEILEKIIYPTLNGIQKESLDYKGVLYFGLIAAKSGVKVLEYNVRFGDPETQVILPKLKNDLVEIILAVISQNLSKINLKWRRENFCGVVVSSFGYPGEFKKEIPLPDLTKLKDVLIFHAGTKKENSKLLSNAGRVLTIVAKGNNLKEAHKAVYQNLNKIDFSNFYYRKDIGKIGWC
ncbi:MAG: phosphoribosylamine--glycine ligase [Armatimonadetes bacterium]|nr:phosphoribosylamine--glycine ligase [Armatimonadota bacterium]